MKLCFKLHPLLVSVIHDAAVLLKLKYFDIVLIELFISFALHFLYLVLKLIHDLIVALLRILLKLYDLVLKLDFVLQFPVVLRLQLSLNLCFVLLLLSELVVKKPN